MVSNTEECTFLPRGSNALILSSVSISAIELHSKITRFLDVSTQIKSITLCIYKKDATVSLATRISVIIGDVLLLAVTWTKTAQAYQEAHRLNIRAPLATMLFRDGAMKLPIILFLFELLIKSFTGTIYFLCVFLILYISLTETYTIMLMATQGSFWSLTCSK